jgi:hypothetical protein
MKHLKILSLAAVAAMVFTAFIGAGTASAGTVTCTVNGSSCASGNEYTGTITSSLMTGTTAVLTNSLDTVTCTASSMNGQTSTATNANGNSTGSISSVSFSGCTDQNNSSCTVTPTNLSWHVEHTSTEIAGKPNGNGKMTISSGGSGGPQATVACGSFINCTFGVDSATVDFFGSSTAPRVTTTGIVMTRISGVFCPSSATWDAGYTITKPTSLFVI